MDCLYCKTSMSVRSGVFGEFYYCPNQTKCGMGTISKIDNRGLVPVHRAHRVSRFDVRPFDPEEDDPYYEQYEVYDQNPN